ncbi:MAG: hypothetical protein AB8H86_33265 [Polyangiales bacterium]
MQYRTLGACLAFCVFIGCDDDTPSPSETTPAREARPVEVEDEVVDFEQPSDESPSEETDLREGTGHGDAPDECPLVVLDADPPLRVRSSPSSDSSLSGELDNGTIVRSVERRDGYVRITSPVVGWVYERMLMRTCDAPPALPALPLGPRTYLLLPSRNVRAAERGTPLPGPVTDAPELLPMRFSFRDARPLATPLPVTLVTERGACETEGTRRVLLVGSCTQMEDYTTALEAIEVPSCTELYPLEPVHPAQMMVGLLGHHEDARLEDWPHADAPITSGQRRVIDRRIRRYVAQFPDDPDPPSVAETLQRFEDSRWSWVEFGVADTILLFHGDSLMGLVDYTSEFPRRVRSGNRLLAGVGGAGHHGYGFYMFPAEARRGLVRESGYPTFSCGPN